MNVCILLLALTDIFNLLVGSIDGLFIERVFQTVVSLLTRINNKQQYCSKTCLLLDKIKRVTFTPLRVNIVFL